MWKNTVHFWWFAVKFLLIWAWLLVHLKQSMVFCVGDIMALQQCPPSSFITCAPMTLSSGPMALRFNIQKNYHYLLYSHYKWTVNYNIKTLIENVIQVEVQLTFSGSRKSKQCRSQFPQLHIQYFLHRGRVWPHITGKKRKKNLSLNWVRPLCPWAQGCTKNTKMSISYVMHLIGQTRDFHQCHIAVTLFCFITGIVKCCMLNFSFGALFRLLDMSQTGIWN